VTRRQSIGLSVLSFVLWFVGTHMWRTQPETRVLVGITLGGWTLALVGCAVVAFARSITEDRDESDQ
jgi:hypothetical protein